MYNDHISQEEAQEIIKHRMKEVEACSRQKQLGFGDPGSARWVFLLILILVAVAGLLV